MIIETILFFVLLAIVIYIATTLFFGRAREASLAMEWDDDDQQAKTSPIGRRLRSLQWNIEPITFVLGVGVLTALVFLLFLEIFPDAFVLAALAALAMGLFAFHLLRDLAAWRVRRFESQLIDAIDLIQAALQGGENPQQALSTAAEASRGAVRGELREIVKRLGLGVPIEKATARVVEHYDSEGVRLFAQVLIAKWQAGGDLGVLLQSVSRIVRERIKLRMRMSGQLAGTRYASIFVAVLPYLVIPVFLWKQPGWLDTLTSHPLGPSLLFAAVFLQVLGFFWLRQILRTDL